MSCVGMNPTGTAGGLHHQTSGLLSREAFKAAGDPSRYPEQIREGLMPWQPRKYYYPAGGPGGGGGQPVAARGRGPLPLGALNAATFDVSGLRSAARPHVRRDRHRRARHAQKPGDGGSCSRCRRAVPAALSADGFVRAASGNPGEEPSLFHGIDTTIPGLASLRRRDASTPRLSRGCAAIADQVAAAQKQFDAGGPFAAAPSDRLQVSSAVRALRQQLWHDGAVAPRRASTSMQRLKTKEDQFTEAALLAHGLRIEVLADDGVVVPGQDVRVSITIGDRGRPVTVSSVTLDGFSKAASAHRGRWKLAAVYRCDAAAQIPATPESPNPTGSRFRSWRATSSSPMRRSACRSARRRFACRSR